jgi:hypothetical protein
LNSERKESSLNGAQSRTGSGPGGRDDEKHDPAGHDRGNTRNGKSPKTLKGEFGELDWETPRDRKATFDPKIVAKAVEVNRVRRQDHLHVRAWYDGAGDPVPPGGDVPHRSSPTLISKVTEAVIEE